MSYISKDYFQKSKAFLFPLTGFLSNEMVEPYGTYLYWTGSESIENYDLIVYYKDSLGRLYQDYERRILLRHTLLSGCYSVEEGNVFIFDLSDYSNDVNYFLDGKYSKMHKKTQKIIRVYNRDFEDDRTPREGRKFHMIFNPELYYGNVSKELGIPTSSLENGVELCSKFDKQKETLSINILNKGNCNNLKEFSEMKLELL